MTHEPPVPAEREGLLPCPFCGAPVSGLHNGGSALFIDCEHSPECWMADFHRVRERAAIAWNHRTGNEDVSASPDNAGNIVYRGEEWVPLASYREAMAGWKAALSTPPARPGREEIARVIVHAALGNVDADERDDWMQHALPHADKILALFDGASA